MRPVEARAGDSFPKLGDAGLEQIGELGIELEQNRLTHGGVGTGRRPACGTHIFPLAAVVAALHGQ
jgi:hypothetical protein